MSHIAETQASPPEENARLEALQQFAIMDTVPEQAFDDLTELASFICGTPVALVSLVDRDRQWFKSVRGLDLRETPRSVSFCANTLESGTTLVVEDAATDTRFHDHPFVTGEPHIRFYAGAPILARGGFVLGAVCVIDTQPRTLSPRQVSALEALARQVMMLLEQRKALADLRSEALKLAQTEETLTRSEELLGFAVEAADLAAWFFDPARNVVGGDQKMAALFGLDVPEGPADLWISAIHPDDQSRVAQEFAASLAGAPYNTEYRVLHGDDVRWVRAKARILGDAGQARIIGICEDITHRKLTEETLQSTAERLRLAQLAGKIATWEWDLTTGRMIWTEGGVWIYGRPTSELGQADDLFAHLHPDDAANVRDQVQSAVATGEDFTTEFRVRWPDDSVHWIQAVGKPVASPAGKPTRVVGLNVDITERKIAEEALIRTEKLAAVGRLASSIAHEINNPLESVTNLLYLARTTNDPDDIRSYLTNADVELRRTSAIVNGTLRFHKQSTSPIAVSCDDLIQSVLGLYHGRLANAGIQVSKRKRAQTPVVCFDGEIRQVLNNLVANAIDAMQGNGGRLILRSREGHDWLTGRHGLIITVADTGAGMSKETRAKLFDAFFTTKGFGGTGLGLWVSREILDRHHGRLSVRSSQTPGHTGSVFCIFLPFDAIGR